MSTRFAPMGPLRGRLVPPPDKSISHRAALFAAMSDEPVTIHNYLAAEDTLSTLDAIRALGAAVEMEPSTAGGTAATASDDGLTVLVRGVGLGTAAPTTGGLLDVGNAGTLLRILPGWLAGQPAGVWTLDGDESIRRRPVDRIVEPLRLMGARIEARDDRFTPLTIEGGPLAGIDYELPVASAQVKSCLLIAGLMAEGETILTEPARSRDHTERILVRARATFSREGRTLCVAPVDELELDDVVVPADPSSAAFLAAAALIVPGSRILIERMGLNWTRTAFFRIAARMGGVVLGDLEEPADRVPAEEPVGDIDVCQAPLEGTVVEAGEVPLAIDELPLVALLGCFAEGETVVRGAEELRLKESDRIDGVVQGLRALGADIEGAPDGFVVRGTGGLEGGAIDSRGDHRLAMLGAIAGVASRGGVEVSGMEAAAISYPAFESDLAALA
ncbi:MAG: 3-phosphoshikimate 1-carboxyvinyltransferase [Thermoleophilaceae bacterium]|jgi:3-phosphoshikimate 1-carboxyvinyltransferase|nr:3-phosphoshikimate 1-carboxyvinyltransferase [Thermoleophilaceae bacterium]